MLPVKTTAPVSAESTPAAVQSRARSSFAPSRTAAASASASPPSERSMRVTTSAPKRPCGFGRLSDARSAPSDSRYRYPAIVVVPMSMAAPKPASPLALTLGAHGSGLTSRVLPAVWMRIPP